MDGLSSGGGRRKRFWTAAWIIHMAVVTGVAAALLVGDFDASSGSHSHAAPSSAAQADQEYASTMRQYFDFGSGTTDDDLVTFGQEVCTTRQPETDKDVVPMVVQYWSYTDNGQALEMIRLSELYLCPAELSPSQTVKYVVTGSPGSVSYGPDATASLTGSVPMSVTGALDSSPDTDFAISAQLNGPGKLTCTIEIDGVAISTDTVSTSLATAYCGATLSPYDRSWENVGD